MRFGYKYAVVGEEFFHGADNLVEIVDMCKDVVGRYDLRFAVCPDDFFCHFDGEKAVECFDPFLARDLSDICRGLYPEHAVISNEILQQNAIIASNINDQIPRPQFALHIFRIRAEVIDKWLGGRGEIRVLAVEEFFFRDDIEKLDEVAGAAKIDIERIAFFVFYVLGIGEIIDRRLLTEGKNAGEIAAFADAACVFMDVTHRAILPLVPLQIYGRTT